nr:galactosylgalactosylxylosylprotein [Hymenolepis microstoma]
MKCRIEFVAISLIILLIIIRSFYTEEKPQLSGCFHNFTRTKLLNLVGDPIHPNKTTVFIITPTYSRVTQKADLVRLCSTLNNVNFVHWIVVEDSIGMTGLVNETLANCGVPYTHLFAMSPFRRRKRVRGSAQRNKGIEWIRNHPVPENEKAIVFFADDDNTYDPRIFKEILTTELGSTWPVGLVGGSMWEGCITDPKDRTKIIAFWCIFRPWRQFPFDMAAFAVNARLFNLFPTAQFDHYRALEQEGVILSQLGFRSGYELEPKVNGCSKILVWHTKTKTPLFFPYFGFQPPPPSYL